MLGSKVSQYLTYQHNVQVYFRAHAAKYDGIVIPLSIITAFPSGTYGFIRALCTADRTKQYGIDPRTALFQKRWNRKNVRDPHRRMAEVFGEPFTTKGLTSCVEPDDFTEDRIADVTANCIDYQNQFRQRPEEAKKLEKYRKLLGVADLKPLGEPQFLVPPYFRFEREGDAWWAVNCACIRAAVKHEANLEIRPVIHFQKWTNITWNSALEKLKNPRISSLWLYPDNFKEHEALPDELEAYLHATRVAAKAGFTPYALFGGYFAILSSRAGMAGFSNGVGYGEWRDSGYHKGGSAERRIYLLKLHKYLDIPEAQALVDANPDYFARDTDLLGACVDGKRPLDDLSLEECLEHFMDCRVTELENVRTLSLGDLLNEFDETRRELAKIGELELGRYGDSLERWRSALYNVLST